jgi:hypothetical protein
MNSTNYNSFEIATKKAFSDLYDLIIIEVERPHKFDLSKMPGDVISCIASGNQLVDYPLNALMIQNYIIFFSNMINQMIIKNILNIFLTLKIIQHLKNTILLKVVKLI